MNDKHGYGWFYYGTESDFAILRNNAFDEAFPYVPGPHRELAVLIQEQLHGTSHSAELGEKKLTKACKTLSKSVSSLIPMGDGTFKIECEESPNRYFRMTLNLNEHKGTFIKTMAGGQIQGALAIRKPEKNICKPDKSYLHFLNVDFVIDGTDYIGIVAIDQE